MTCEHEDFVATVEVARITETEGGPVVGFYADVRVHCVACDEPMVFRGLPVGLSQREPRISADGREVHLPIVPQSADPHFGARPGRVRGPGPRGACQRAGTDG